MPGSMKEARVLFWFLASSLLDNVQLTLYMVPNFPPQAMKELPPAPSSPQAQIKGTGIFCGKCSLAAGLGLMYRVSSWP